MVSGCEMGGGPVSQVLIDRARNGNVVMTRSAALTIHHDPEIVLSHGIEIIEDDELKTLSGRPRTASLEIGDLESDRLEQIVESFGVPFDFDVVGACAQDHGMPPSGVSHLDYRHNLFKDQAWMKPPFRIRCSIAGMRYPPPSTGCDVWPKAPPVCPPARFT